mmetsp:Transcript_111923/g.348761  ORF Transcript_111923/g.348761 Transcript_111923/m.348761 type:complete len:228 (-) Transcript_111923:43-726(-)
MALRLVLAPLALLLASALPLLGSCESDEVTLIQRTVDRAVEEELKQALDDEAMDAEAVEEDLPEAQAEVEQEAMDAEAMDAEAGFQLRLRLSKAEVHPAAAGFATGSVAEINVMRCLPEGAWVESEIASLGDKADTYNIKIHANPEDHREMPNTPAEILRGPKGQKTFHVGQHVGVKVSKCLDGGSWMPCRVVGEGSEPGKYNVLVADSKGKYQRIPDVPAGALRKK